MATKKAAPAVKASKASKSAKTEAPAAKAGKSAKTESSTAKEKSLGDLVGALAEKVNLPKAKVREILDAHAELLTQELQSAGSVQLAGIGKLKMGERAARTGRNPATGETIQIKASKTVKFSGGKNFKDSFNA